MRVPFQSIHSLGVAAGCLLLSSCVDGNFGPGASSHLERTIDFSPGGQFRLENTNGRVEIETWNQEKVEIQAEKTASTPDALDRVRIEINGHGDHVDVRTETPHAWFIFGEQQ